MHRLLWLLGTLTLMGSVACGSASSPPASGSPTASPPSATQSDQSIDLGPLAVIDSPGGGPDARGGTGPVHIDGSCVTMTRENGEILLLIWQSAQVRWDEQEQEITFSRASDTDANPITIREGDTITVGGESLIGDVPVERNLTWLATPRENCSGEAWIVSGLTKP